MSNLNFINQTDITSGVTTINVDNVFSNDYRVYFCEIAGVFHNTDVSNGIEGIRFIDNSGSVITGSEYDNATLVLKSDTAFQQVRNTSQSYMNMYLITDQQSDGVSSSSFYIYTPYESDLYTYMHYQSTGINSSSKWGAKGISVHKSEETIRGFQLYESNGARTFGGGKINVYGVQ